MSKGLIITPKDINPNMFDPENYEKFRQVFEQGISTMVPVQRSIDATRFQKKFYVLYQLSKETFGGERYDLRVFFRDANPAVAQELGRFCMEFVAKYFDPLKGKTEIPIDVMFQPAIKIRWQYDLLMLNIPGRWIEMIHDIFLKTLLQKFGS